MIDFNLRDCLESTLKTLALRAGDALEAQRRRNVQLDNYELKRLSVTAPCKARQPDFLL